MLSVSRLFSLKIAFLATGCEILGMAGAALGQTIDEPAAILSQTSEGNMVWKPTAHGLNKYSIVMPRDAIEEALRYDDTSTLFYLSDISELDFEVSEGTTPWGELWLAREQYSFDINWSTSKLAYLGLHLDYNGKDNLDASASVNAIMASNSHSMHEIRLSIGEQIQLQASGAMLQLGNMSENFYIASLSSEGADSFGISFGQRHWRAFSKLDFAWAAGAEGGNAFSSAQFEGNMGTATGFLRLTAQSNASPRLDLGLQYNLHKSQLGSWQITASSRKKGYSALDGPSLEHHRSTSLAKLWAHDVTLKALRKVRDGE